VLVGAQLLGVLGVLLALPIAAAVPVIERIWGGPGSGPEGPVPITDPGDVEGSTDAEGGGGMDG